ncbi:MAG TPA: hypothetical protein PKE26_03580 [Kiritimatiellia bacterium]|nr:hypothetical protein [Kiritimatiellia bacterium]HMO98171.1 hypothetical protein [Kiritimatiellia bacterium]HMP97581.1 hypothetical protein [Kiritimatiellia bacterium]
MTVFACSGFRRWLPFLLVVITTFSIPAMSLSGPSPEIDDDFLALVMRHLYRWHLDETALLAVDAEDELVLMLRDVTPALDENDQSRYVEILVPALSFSVLLKRADYALPELGLRVTNADYRVMRAHKLDVLPEDFSGWTRRTLSKSWLLQYLFSIRNERNYPDEALMARLQQAFRERYGATGAAEGPQTIYIAPLSRVSNNLWVFWENAGKIIRFSSDSDIDSEAYWAIEKVGVTLYDLEEDVVVSLAEVSGSNAYVTRDWAARVLYNCVVFGRRVLLEPLPAGGEEAVQGADEAKEP